MPVSSIPTSAGAGVCKTYEHVEAWLDEVEATNGCPLLPSHATLGGLCLLADDLRLDRDHLDELIRRVGTQMEHVAAIVRDDEAARDES